MHKAIKVRVYPNQEQSQMLSQQMGCSRWWWNFALNLCNQTYKETGKGLNQFALNAYLPKLKQEEETKWLGDCYSQILQSTTLNLTRAFKNFFEKRAKYQNPRHIKKHEKNLARKQKKLSRKQKGSNSRNKARVLVAKVHERISNARQGYLHKLSRKIVNNNQVVVVEQLNIKGMVRNRKLAKAISDVGWGMFVNFLDYKLKEKGGVLIEIDRWFSSSKTCSNCLYQMPEMPLDIREWTCPSCGTHHDRDENASKNIRAEGIRILKTDGTAVSADGGTVRPKKGRKSVLRHEPVKSEAPTSAVGGSE